MGNVDCVDDDHRNGFRSTTFCPSCCATACTSPSTLRSWRKSCASWSRRRPSPWKISTDSGMLRSGQRAQQHWGLLFCAFEYRMLYSSHWGNWGVIWHLKTNHKTIFTLHSVRCAVSICMDHNVNSTILTRTWGLMFGSFWVIKCDHCHHLKIMHVHRHLCFTHTIQMYDEPAEREKLVWTMNCTWQRVTWSINTVMTVH